MRGYWTCQRVTAGVKCGAVHANRFQVCQACGKRRPPRKPPAHMAALSLSYEEYVELNGGEWCGICHAGPEARLMRDHDHRKILPRGLLCFRCNMALRTYATLEWLQAALAYVERAENRARVPLRG